MSEPITRRAPLRAIVGAVVAVLVTAVVAVVILTDLPAKLGLPGGPGAHEDQGGQDHEDHAAADAPPHEDGHEGHVQQGSIELSPQARANLRLAVEPVSMGRFTEHIEIPASVTDWPGRTHVAITSPLTGVINAIAISRGELIQSGATLFTLRLTHQDLVRTQQDFLTSLGQLDVEQREIERLTSIANSGAIAGRMLITREYERDKLMASMQAAKQSMLLHGLTESQVSRIERTRKLIREVTIYAPTLHADRSLHHDSLQEPQPTAANASEARLTAFAQPPPTPPEHFEAEFLVTQLSVSRGDAVETGQILGQLSDYSQLLIEGHAYQRDGEALKRAADSDLPLQAVMESTGETPEVIEGLKIIYIGNEINRQSRALPFYVALENEFERSEQRGSHRYVSWRYKPGQRLTLRVPVAGFDDAIVVPKDAVAEEGPERYVFVENSDHFDRVAVHVLASDSMNVAIANDGQVWPGQSIAVNGAHQLQMAMKNQAGGAPDPHAGHNH